ncbi:MAG: nucleoside monophosphate kinase [Verrucomicrobium sp.]|nr:nucleoside monophosphate kinase [Verrucomicrobium sp.]
MLRRVQYETILLFGAPGSGKGTQGKILGTIPGFFHFASGDVFRSIDLDSELGKAFLEYSKRGDLVPDDLTIQLWSDHLEKIINLGRFRPESDFLVLDGIPRTVSQAEMLSGHIHVHRIYHLSCPERAKLIERMRARALKQNRFDDANEEVIRHRLKAYDNETKPVLDYYGKDVIVEIDAAQRPHKVLLDILADLAGLKPAEQLVEDE